MSVSSFTAGTISGTTTTDMDDIG